MLFRSAYMVVVPNVVSDTPALRRNPIFLYYQDTFQKPAPFRPDVAVPVDDVWDIKINGLDAHVSQFYEWLPWLDGALNSVPQEPDARRTWLKKSLDPYFLEPARRGLPSLQRWYGKAAAKRVRYAELFEVCEYGRQPSHDEILEKIGRASCRERV